MNQGRPQGPMMAAPGQMITEHDIRVFVLKPERYDKACAEMKTWMDGVSYRGGQIANITSRIHDDGTITIIVIGARQDMRRVATAMPVMQSRE